MKACSIKAQKANCWLTLDYIGRLVSSPHICVSYKKAYTSLSAPKYKCLLILFFFFLFCSVFLILDSVACSAFLRLGGRRVS